MLQTKRYLISGTVQGVSFRASTCVQAQSLKLTGWVRNLADSRVETVATGSAEQLDRFFKWLHKGPSLAQVSAVHVEDLEPTQFLDFQIRFS